MIVQGIKYVITPDKEQRDLIREGLKNTGGYCPCVVEKTPDTKCPCKEFRETGDCHCGLWVKKEN